MKCVYTFEDFENQKNKTNWWSHSYIGSTVPSKWKFWKHRRYVVAILAFFGFFNVYCLRVNLSIAIVAMTSDRFETLENGTKVNIGPEFHWDNKIQGYILSSFFYGYITTQLVGGYFAAKYGGKFIFGTGIAVTAALTIVSPWLASANVYLFLAVRIIEGIFEGVTCPSLHAIWAQWAPPLERTRLAMIASSGSYFGTVIAMPVSALLANAFGWESIFFFFGAVGLIWYAFWMMIVSNSPAEDSKIDAWELEYIESSMEINPNDRPDKLSVPWKSIMTSKAVMAICAANFCENWGFYTFLTQLPKYLKDIYSFDLGTSGFLSGLPYLLMAIMVPIAGQVADYLITKKYLTVTQTRRSFNFVGFMAQFIFIMAVAFVSNQTVTVFCLTMAVGIGALAWAGFSVNPLDIAPQYASILLGTCNTFGTMPGIMSPILSGYIVSNNPTVPEWQVVFFITAGIYLFGAIVFVTCASGELQPWAQTNSQKSKSNSSKEKEACDKIKCKSKDVAI